MWTLLLLDGVDKMPQQPPSRKEVPVEFRWKRLPFGRRDIAARTQRKTGLVGSAPLGVKPPRMPVQRPRPRPPDESRPAQPRTPLPAPGRPLRAPRSPPLVCKLHRRRPGIPGCCEVPWPAVHTRGRLPHLLFLVSHDPLAPGPNAINRVFETRLTSGAVSTAGGAGSLAGALSSACKLCTYL